MKLSRLLVLQLAYAVMAIAYLSASLWQVHSGGVQFSKAEPLPNIALFTLYAACLLFGVYGRDRLYRTAMAIAILMFATGGVFINIFNMINHGVAGYSSISAWAIGVAINVYGMIWNVVAATGAYRR